MKFYVIFFALNIFIFSSVHAQELKAIYKSTLGDHEDKMVNTIKHMIATNADPNLPIPGHSTLVLWWTCHSDKRIALSEQLLKMGANPNLPTNNGDRPLDAALAFGAIQSTKLLLNSGANPNLISCILNQSLLHKVVSPYSSFIDHEARISLARFLLEYYAYTEIKDCRGKTPLALAQEHFPNTELVTTLEYYSKKQKIS